MELQNRYDIKAFLVAQNCNPNGDPDNSNLPRQDENGYGYITDVSIKRTFRECASKFGKNIHLTMGKNLTDEGKEIKANKKTDPAEVKKSFCERFFDVRTFGEVVTAINEGIKGAVQVGFARSIVPVHPVEICVTSCVAREENKNRTMGTKTILPFGVYELTLSISTMDAQKVGFTEEDFKDFINIFTMMYNENNSSSKMGLTLLDPIFVFKHPNALGRMNSNILFNSITMTSDKGETASSLKDYILEINKSILRKGVELFVSSFGDDGELTPVDKFDFGETETLVGGVELK